VINSLVDHRLTSAPAAYGRHASVRSRETPRCPCIYYYLESFMGFMSKAFLIIS